MDDKLTSNKGSSRGDYHRDFRNRSAPNTQHGNPHMPTPKPEYSAKPNNYHSNQTYSASSNTNEHGYHSSGGASSQRNDRIPDNRSNYQNSSSSQSAQRNNIPPDNRGNNQHSSSSQSAQRNNIPPDNRGNNQHSSSSQSAQRNNIPPDNRGNHQHSSSSQSAQRNNIPPDNRGNNQHSSSSQSAQRNNIPPDNRGNHQHSPSSQSAQRNNIPPDNRGNHQHSSSSQSAQRNNIPPDNRGNHQHSSSSQSAQRNNIPPDNRGNHQHSSSSQSAQRNNIPPDNRGNHQHSSSSQPTQRNDQLLDKRSNNQLNSNSHTGQRRDERPSENRVRDNYQHSSNSQPIRRNDQQLDRRSDYPQDSHTGQRKDLPTDNRNIYRHNSSSQSAQRTDQSQDNRGNYQQNVSRPAVGHPPDTSGNYQHTGDKYNQSLQQNDMKGRANDPTKDNPSQSVSNSYNDKYKNKGYHGSMGNVAANTVSDHQTKPNSQESQGRIDNHPPYNRAQDIQQQNQDYKRHEETSFYNQSKISDANKNQSKDRRDHTYQNHGYQSDKHQQAYANGDRNQHHGNKRYEQSVPQGPNNITESKPDQHMKATNYQNKRIDDSEKRNGYENRGYHHDDDTMRNLNNKQQGNYNKESMSSYHGSNVDKTPKYGENVPDYRKSNQHINNTPENSARPKTTSSAFPNESHQVPNYHGSTNQINNYQYEATRPKKAPPNAPSSGQMQSYHGSNYQINKDPLNENKQPVSYHKSAPAPVAPHRNKHLSTSKPDLSSGTQNESSQQQHMKSQYRASSKPDLSKSYENINREASQYKNIDAKNEEKSTVRNTDKNTGLHPKQYEANNQGRNRISSDESNDKRKYEKRITANISNAPSAKRRDRIQSHQETGISGPIPKSYRNSNVPKNSGFDPTPPTRTTSMGALNQIGQPSFISSNPSGSTSNQSNLYRSNSVPAISVTQESGNLNSAMPHSHQNGGLYKSQSILSLAMIQTQQTNLQRSASLASLVASNPNLARTASVYAMYELQLEQGIIPKDHNQTQILAFISIFLLPPISFLLGGLCLYYTVQNEPVWKTNLPLALQTNTRIFWCCIGLIVLSVCVWFTVILVVLLHHA